MKQCAMMSDIDHIRVIGPWPRQIMAQDAG